MATGNLVKHFSDEATCSLCLEHFKNPVTVDCGHNFCQECITQCLEKAQAGPFCPQCRQPISPRNFKPNRQLANLVELIKKLEQEKQEEEKKRVCWKHQEPLKLFCKEDQMLICVVCDKSKEHKEHNVVPLEEASQEYKEKIKNEIPSLERKRKELEDLRSEEEQKSQKFLTLLEMERQEGLAAFEQLQEALEGNKRAWLCCLGDLEKKMEENWRENADELLKEITDLSSLIAEIEKKCQEPVGEFLQDITKCLERYKSAEDKNVVLKPSQELDSTLAKFTYERELLESIFKDFQDSLEKALQEVHVTLDPDTAHPCLSISEDQRSVSCGERCEDLPFKPERFDTVECVLGCEKFTVGRHYWDVEIEGNQTTWMIGVARESIRRKGDIKFSLDEGIWAIRPSSTRASSQPLNRVRVSLDYEAGRVVFSDACTGKSLFVFSSACFAGEGVCPFFQVSLGTTLKCC